MRVFVSEIDWPFVFFNQAWGLNIHCSPRYSRAGTAAVSTDILGTRDLGLQPVVPLSRRRAENTKGKESISKSP